MKQFIMNEPDDVYASRRLADLVAFYTLEAVEDVLHGKKEHAKYNEIARHLSNLQQTYTPLTVYYNWLIIFKEAA